MSPLERRFTARWSDVDANGHMRNTAYSGGPATSPCPMPGPRQFYQ